MGFITKLVNERESLVALLHKPFTVGLVYWNEDFLRLGWNEAPHTGENHIVKKFRVLSCLLELDVRSNLKYSGLILKLPKYTNKN